MRNPSEIPPAETKLKIDSLPIEEIKRLAFTMIKINEHLEYHSQNEVRQREKIRLKIAQKNITKWYNNFNE